MLEDTDCAHRLDSALRQIQRERYEILFDQIRGRILFMTPLAEVPKPVDWSVPSALCEKDREEHHSKIAKCVKKMIEGQISLSIGGSDQSEHWPRVGCKSTK